MPLAFAEGAITHLRRERKVLLDPAEADAIWDRVGRELRGVPMGPTLVTTVYFDRPGFPLARRAQEFASDCLKVRVKEYAPDRDGDGSRVVLEVKRERALVTSKERLWIPRAAVRPIVTGAVPGAPSACDARLSPVVATRYERHVFQTCDSWRVTLDRGLAFHAVDWTVFAGSSPARCRLAPAFARDDAAVLELKYVGDDVPGWLGELVSERARPFSKFVHAMAMLRAHDAAGEQRC